MSSEAVKIRYRPFRVAFCVQNGRMDQVREAMRLNSTFWGGRFNPIVPAGDDRIAHDLIKKFRVDGLIAVGESPEQNDLLKLYPHLPPPEFFAKKLYQASGGRKSSLLLTARRALQTAIEDHQKDRSSPQFDFKLIRWDPGDPLADVFLAFFGQYPDASEVDFDYETGLKNTLGNDIELHLGSGALSQQAFDSWGPLSVTQYDLEAKFSPRDRSLGSDGIYCGDCSRFEDIVAFWNLLASGRTLVFYDPAHPSRTLDLVRFIERELVAEFSSVSLWHYDVDSVPQTFLAGPVVRHAIFASKFPGYSVSSPIFEFKRQEALAHFQSEPYRNCMVLLPPKPWPESSSTYNNEHLIASLTMYGERGQQIVPPYVPKANRLLARRLNFTKIDSIRCEEGSVGVLIGESDTELGLTPFTKLELLQDIFKTAGIDLSLSSAGHMTNTLIAQVGGIMAVRVFKIAGVRELITKHRYDESFPLKRATSWMESNWKPSYGTFNVTQPEGAEQAPSDIVRFCLEKEIFRLGLNLKCPSCTLKNWYSVDQLKSQLVCTFCGSSFQSLVSIAKSEWMVRASGIFASNNISGGIPVAMTLQQLESTFSFGHCFSWLPCVDLKVEGKACESDFVTISSDREDRPCVLIGECKTGHRINKNDINNLDAMATQLEKIGITCKIVFTKLDGFSENELRLCASLNRNFENRVILLSLIELEPFRIFENRKDELPDYGPHSIEELASATRATYLKNYPHTS